MTKSILKECVPNRSRSPKHDRRREEDLERVHEVAINWELEPEEDVVDQCDRNGGGDAIIREHVYLKRRLAILVLVQVF